MSLISLQRCQEATEMVPIEVPSHSDPDKTYVVLIPSEDEDPICECRGFEVRGHCSHQQEALEAQCLWDEAYVDAEEQTPEQRHEQVCPRCGGPTEWYMEID